jgi:hypothetical protein
VSRTRLSVFGVWHHLSTTGVVGGKWGRVDDGGITMENLGTTAMMGADGVQMWYGAANH